MAFHIGIVGNIGSGKSTLAESVGELLAAPVFAEHVDTNPFLDRFYRDPVRWAFASSLHFLLGSATDQRRIEALEGFAVQDRPACEQLDILVGRRVDLGIFDADEHDLLRRVVTSNTQGLPDLIVYLDTDPGECLRRIAARGRSYETPDLLPLGMLEDLHQRYQDFIAQPQICERLIVVSSSEPTQDVAEVVATEARERQLHGICEERQ